MPLYIYVHPETEEMVELHQKMTDVHAYIDKDGTEWSRVFTPTNFNVEGRPNPWSPKKFIEKTRDGKGTVGELWDRAKEASEMRIQKEGYDPIQKENFKKYSEERKGKKHPNDSSGLV
jgi:hypothetical protein